MAWTVWGNGRISMRITQEEQAANIRLLAAAPAMREALQNLEDCAALVIDRWEHGDLADAVRSLVVDRDNARAILAAIEGA